MTTFDAGKMFAFDLETTGTNPHECRIVTSALVRIDGGAPQAKELLAKAAGLDGAKGDERLKKIVHRVLEDTCRTIEEFDVTPNEFWAAVGYLTRLGQANEAGLLDFCDRYGLPLRVIAHADIEARPCVTQPSAWVQQNVGLPGVCEPCALIASPRGRLIVPKTALNGVTVAVVEDRLPLEVSA